MNSGLSRQLKMVLKNRRNWNDNKIMEARRIFLETATLEDHYSPVGVNVTPDEPPLRPEPSQVVMKERTQTPMPEWLERQFDNVERTTATWSPGKREAAGLPPIDPNAYPQAMLLWVYDRSVEPKEDEWDLYMFDKDLRQWVSFCYDQWQRAPEAYTHWVEMGSPVAEFTPTKEDSPPVRWSDRVIHEDTTGKAIKVSRIELNDGDLAALGATEAPVEGKSEWEVLQDATDEFRSALKKELERVNSWFSRKKGVQ